MGRRRSLPAGEDVQARTWLDEWLLGKTLLATLRELDLDEWTASQSLKMVKILTLHRNWAAALSPRKAQMLPIVESWLQDQQVCEFVGVNLFDDVLWFNQEAFEAFLWWLMAVAIAGISGAAPPLAADKIVRHTVYVHDVIKRILDAEIETGYQVDQLLELVAR